MKKVFLGLIIVLSSLFIGIQTPKAESTMVGLWSSCFETLKNEYNSNPDGFKESYFKNGNLSEEKVKDYFLKTCSNLNSYEDMAENDQEAFDEFYNKKVGSWECAYFKVGCGNLSSGSGSESDSSALQVARGALVRFFDETIALLHSDFNSFFSRYTTEKNLDVTKVRKACETYIRNYLDSMGTHAFTNFSMNQVSDDFNEQYSKLYKYYIVAYFEADPNNGSPGGAPGSEIGDNPVQGSKDDLLGKWEDEFAGGYFKKIKDCRTDLLGIEFADILQEIFTAFKIVTPILMIVLIMKDFVTAATAGKVEDMKKAQSTAMKRMAIGLVIFFVPTLVNLVLGLIGMSTGTCGIG